MRQLIILFLLVTVASLSVEAARLAVNNEVKKSVDEMNGDIEEKLRTWDQK